MGLKFKLHGVFSARDVVMSDAAAPTPASNSTAAALLSSPPRRVIGRETAVPGTPPPTGGRLSSEKRKRSHSSAFYGDTENEAEVAAYTSLYNREHRASPGMEDIPTWGAKRSRSMRSVVRKPEVRKSQRVLLREKRARATSARMPMKVAFPAPVVAVSATAAAGVVPKKRGRKPGTKNKRPSASTAASATATAIRAIAPRAAKAAALKSTTIVSTATSVAASALSSQAVSGPWSSRLRQRDAKKARF